MKLDCKRVAQALAAIACILWLSATHSASAAPTDDAALSAALCPIVYPVDPVPSERGHRYLFYGNGFFINEQGYLITVAHVLSQIRGGQPYILLRPPAGPPRFIPATLVALDRDHDVAILRAAPNPFEAGLKVGFLPLAGDPLARGRAVLAASISPSKPLDAHTLDASVDERSSGELFDFQFSQLEKGRSDTELLLFNHQVRPGQSGAPLVSAGSQGVIGLVEGQWLRSNSVLLAAAAHADAQGVGAAVSIHYAIALLQQKNIAWHNASEDSRPSDSSAAQADGFSPPAPLSLVASPYPSQSLFGGEVVLDVLIDTRGRVTDTRVVRGAPPFLENVLSSVRTWTFFPARLGGLPVAARVGITFQFSQSYEPLRATPAHDYDEPLPDSPDRGALPVSTVPSKYPAAGAEDGSVILYGLVGSQGQLTSLQILRDSEPLTAAALAAVHQWRFVPGRLGGRDIESVAILVVAFRYTGTARPVPPAN